jgi:malate dehydrogenase
VIGAGNVGATCASNTKQKNIGEIVMLDIYEGFAKGKALDMSQGGQVLNYDGKITGTKDYTDIAGADVVVVTSGFPRKPGMSREDLVGVNADIISQVGSGIREHAPDSVIVMVTNPLDLMTESGACSRMPDPTWEMMSAFTPTRSSRDMPGLRGNPDVTTTTSAPAMSV